MADGALESVFADQIEEGDKLVSWKGSKMTEEAVVAVEPVIEKGTWAPLTMEGTLLVDGLLASCYAYFSQTLSDLALVPVKMFPRIDHNTCHWPLSRINSSIHPTHPPPHPLYYCNGFGRSYM